MTAKSSKTYLFIRTNFLWCLQSPLAITKHPASSQSQQCLQSNGLHTAQHSIACHPSLLPHAVHCCHRATTQLQLEGVIASAAHCDVTNKAEVDALVNWTVQTYGAIDLLIANAGIVKGADFLDMTENDFDDVVRVNLKGVFLVSVLCPLDLHAGSKCQHWCVHAELQILMWITEYVFSFNLSQDLYLSSGSGTISPENEILFWQSAYLTAAVYAWPAVYACHM